MNIKIYKPENFETHEACISWKEGDIVYFKCKQCEYIRQMNFKTGDTKVIEQGNFYAFHKGYYMPYDDKINTNEN